MDGKQKVVVVGAGPVGSLAALYAAKRGHDVEIYELRSDLRDPSTTPLNFTKSINLALSERGLNAMRHSGHPQLLEHVSGATIPMRGRMIHGKRPNGDLYEESQDYDVHGRSILAVDRGGLNKRLLDTLDDMPNVRFFFGHKMTGADFRKRKAWFEVQDGDRREIEVNFDLMLGADGAHSSVRYHLMKYTRMDYQQEYIDALWCEFQIQPKQAAPDADLYAKFRISPNHLHIWPGKEFMFIAIPSDDGTFTCTLFAPSDFYQKLEADASQIPSLFDRHFPGVTALISPEELIAQFQRNPHLPLINIKCKPYHYSSSVVILGDAAHAMVPFYGQGMNSGLEDVRVLFDILDKHTQLASRPQPDSQTPSTTESASQRALALTEYSAVRVPDAHAINELALQNYVEMRASVLSPTYRLRKWLEEKLSVHVPSLGWQTKYSRVSFGNERYSDVIAKSEHQGKVLVAGMVSAVGVPMLAAGILWWTRYRRTVDHGAGILLGWPRCYLVVDASVNTRKKMSSSTSTAAPALPTVAETLQHPAFPTAVWKLEPDQEGFLPVAEGRGGPFKIHWEIHGTGPIKVIFIMGLGAIKSAWQRQALHFGHEQHDRYSVLVFDNRGVGDSDKPLMRYTTSEMARDAAEVLAHVGWAAPADKPQPARNVHVVGLSLGGMIAQEVACLIPGALASLSLCCTAAEIENTTTFTENITKRASMLLPRSVEASVSGAARQMFPEAFLHAPDDTHLPDPDATRKVHPPAPGTAYLRFDSNYERFVAQEMHKRLDAARFTVKGFMMQLVAAGWHRKSAAQLAAMADAVGRERIVVMHGTVDGMISPPHGRKLIDYVQPRVGLMVDGMGHVPMIERWEWFNKLLEEQFAYGEKLKVQT